MHWQADENLYTKRVKEKYVQSRKKCTKKNAVYNYLEKNVQRQMYAVDVLYVFLTVL